MDELYPFEVTRYVKSWDDYTVGLYDLLAKFQAKRPHIMVQACASGGGHMDFGFLRYADEFWASDDTDPFMRSDGSAL